MLATLSVGVMLPRAATASGGSLSFAPSQGYNLVSGGGNSDTNIGSGALRSNGRQDIVVGGSAGVNVFLSNGDGTYRQAVVYDTGRAYYAVAVADVTGDGKPDIIATNDPAATVTILPGNGDGTFGSPTVLGVPGPARAIGTGDLNGDGSTDFVLGTTSAVIPFLNNGSGVFTEGTAQNYPSDDQMSIGNLVVADVTGDGHPDVIAGSTVESPSGLCSSACSGWLWFANNGSGALDPASGIRPGSSAYTFWPIVRLADVNGDGHPDIVALTGANGYGNPGEFAVAFNNAPGGSRTPTVRSRGHRKRVI